MEKLGLLSLAINNAWHLPVDKRQLTEPRAALDKAYVALVAQAEHLRLDSKPLLDTMARMNEGIDAYASRTFSQAPVLLSKSTAGAQMNLVLKTLAREART
jgi:hypothetical protein